MHFARRPVIAIAAMLFGCGISLSATPRAITEAEAKELIYAMLKADGYTSLRGFALRAYDGTRAFERLSFPDFIFVDATYDNPEGGSSIGHYAVDKATADLWDWVSCGRYNSASLLKAQQTLRIRIGVYDGVYRRLRKLGPWCEAGEKPEDLKMGPRMW